MSNVLDPITLAVPGALTVSFTDIDDVQAWLDQQADAWTPLLAASFTGKMEEWRRTFLQNIESLRILITNYRHVPDIEKLAAWRLIQHALKDWEKSPWMDVRTSEGHSLAMLAISDTMTATIRIAAFMGQPIKLSQISADGDFVRLLTALLPIALKSRATAEEDNFLVTSIATQLGAVYSKAISDVKQQFDSLMSEAQASIQIVNDERDSLWGISTGLEIRMQRLQRLAAERIRSGRRDIQALSLAYRTQLQLQAPATYWRQRAFQNSMQSVIAFVTFVVCAAISLFVFFFYAPIIKSFVSDHDGKVQLASVALVSPIVILVIWLFRMISRIFTLSVAESIDASQREVMVTTFLALTKDPTSKLTESERIIILQALFRSSSAKVDEEQIPTSMLDLLAKAVSGKPA